MAAKTILFHHDAQAKILQGIQTLAEAVRITLGPKARTVVLERSFGPPLIINSGVVVAKEIELNDPFENMGAQMVKEVAAKTSDVAGDGTSTATVLAHGIAVEGMKYVVAGMNPMDLKRGIGQAVIAVVEESTSDYDREKPQERLAKLAGGVAVVKVGAATETRTALQNAASIAGLILTTDCLIAHLPEERRRGRPPAGDDEGAEM